MKEIKLVLCKTKTRMMELKPKAKELRKMGLSFREIGATLKISAMTAHRWCKNVKKGKFEV